MTTPATTAPLRVSLIAANPMMRRSLVSPIGCERLAGVLLSSFPRRVECFVSAPFLVRSWRRVLADELSRARPDLVCISFRNLDECVPLRPDWEAAGDLAVGCESFLSPLREAVALVRATCDAPILLGGMGLACAPTEILRATNCRFGIVGPGEPALVHVVGRVLAGEDPTTVLATGAGRLGMLDLERPGPTEPASHAAPFPFGPARTPRHPVVLDALIKARERVPVVLSHGCDRGCAYCVESALFSGRVVVRPVEDVIAEVRWLAARGIRKLWLTCSEANAGGGRHAATVFRGLARLGLDLDLRAYFCMGGIRDDLLDAMEDAGIRPYEQSYEFGHLAAPPLKAGYGPASRRALDDLVGLFLRRGYPSLGGTVVFGGPAETEETLLEAAEVARTLDRTFPEGFGLTASFGLRLYPSTRVGREVLADPTSHAPHLYPRAAMRGRGLVPLFYSRPHSPPLTARLFRSMAGDLGGGLVIASSLWKSPGGPRGRGRGKPDGPGSSSCLPRGRAARGASRTVRTHQRGKGTSGEADTRGPEALARATARRCGTGRF